LNFGQRLGQEIHVVEIEEGEDRETVDEMTIVDVMHIHHSPSFHRLKPMRAVHLFD